MTSTEIYFLFLEEALELLPLIQAGLRELSHHDGHLGTKHSLPLETIVSTLSLVNNLALGVTQVRETLAWNQEVSIDFINLEKLQTLIDNLKNLLNSCQQQTSTSQPLELQQLWPTYTELKYCLLTHLNQSPTGKFGLLAKGEFLFSCSHPQTKDNLAATRGIDLDFQEAILNKDIVQSLANLELVLASSDLEEQSTELEHQADVLYGLGELLELHDLVAIAKSVHRCTENNFAATQLIGKRALACWQEAHAALSKDTNHDRGKDWRNYLFLLEDDRKATSITPNIELALVEPSLAEPVLKTDQFFMWLSGFNIFFLPANRIFAMVIAQAEKIKYLDNQKFFVWQEDNIPLYQLAALLNYNYLLPDDFDNYPSSLILVVQHNSRLIALEIEVEQPLVESELTLKSFSSILTTPSYVRGSTLLGDNRLKILIEVETLLNQL